MKRVTLLVHECTASPTVVILGWRAGDAPTQEIVIASRLVESIEDVPDPLPTTPGERFWGRADGYADQWWFVVRCSTTDPSLLVYIPAGGSTAVMSEEVAAANLVRLPDPGSQP